MKIIAYTVIVVFIIAVGYFLSSIYIEFQNGPALAEQEFSSFLNKTSILITSSDFTNNEYIQDLQTAVLENSRIAAAILSVEDQVTFAYPVSSKLITINSKGIPNLEVSSSLLQTFSSIIPTQTGENVILNVALYILRPQDIYNSARISFLIILACTLVIIFLLICLSFSSKTHTDTEPMEVLDVQPEPSYTQPEPSYTQPEPSYTQPEPSYTQSEIETIPIFFRDNKDQRYPFYKSTKKTQSDELSNEDIVDFEKTKDDIIASSTDSVHPDEDKSSQDPTGLFSNTTGLSWEAYMETRLDAELIRAASSEQDLSLLLIQIKGIEENKILLKKTTETLLDYFKFKDFIFEFKHDGFAGILLNVNIDKAMRIAESLYIKLHNFIVEENFTNKIGIGISTRTLRLLTANRIIAEATKALEKSFSENELPIVAFRVNSEKYRQFVSDPKKSVSSI